MEKQDQNRIRKLLWRWGRCDKRISELIEQMRIAKSCMDDLYNIGHSPSMDGMPRSTVPGDPVMREFERIQQARDNFREEVEACERELLDTQRFKAAMNRAVKELPGLEEDIIRMRYQKGHTFVYIAAMCSINERTAYRREEKAIEELGKKIVWESVNFSRLSVNVSQQGI